MTTPLNSRFQEFSALLLVAILAALSLFLALRWAAFSIDLLVVSAFLIGLVLGLRWPVFAMLRTSAAYAVITVALNLARGNYGADAIALNVLVVHFAHQIGYLFGVASFPYILITEKSIVRLARAFWGQSRRDKRVNSVIDLRGRGRKNVSELPAPADRRTSAIGLTPTGDLLNTVENLARAVSVDAILEIIRSSARHLIGSDGVALILAEGDLCHYVEEDAVGPLWKGRKFKMTECISGWSMMNRRTAVIEDISTDERIPYHLYAETFVKSLVMTPVGTDLPIGALGAYWASTYQPTDYEIETVKILARSTATAIENAKLFSMLSHSLAQAELRQDELRHRAENAYLAAQSLAHVSLAPESAEMFSARIAVLAQTHEALDQKLALQKGIDIRELMRSELEAFGADTLSPAGFEGPALLLDRAQAIALGVAVNELATSALKDRAWGWVSASWRVEKNCLLFEWCEGAVHSGAADERLGSKLLHRLIEDQLGGKVRQRFTDNDLICEIEFPLHEINSPASARTSSARTSSARTSSATTSSATISSSVTSSSAASATSTLVRS